MTLRLAEVEPRDYTYICTQPVTNLTNESALGEVGIEVGVIVGFMRCSPAAVKSRAETERMMKVQEVIFAVAPRRFRSTSRPL